MQTFHPGELPLVLLALAEHEPMKAYGFLSELEEAFGPSYKPSPGGVYPALTALVEEGLLLAVRADRGKRYELTPAGRAALDRRRGQLEALESRTGVTLRRGASLRSHLERFAECALAAAELHGPDHVIQVLETTTALLNRGEAHARN